MKTRISLLIASLAFLMTSAFTTPAQAEVERSKLIGYWSGDLVVFFHGNAKGMQIEVNFQKNGDFSLKQLENGKIDKAKWKIEGEKILITDGKGKDTYFVDVELSDDKFNARFEPTQKANEQNLSIEIKLRRGKAQINKDKK